MKQPAPFLKPGELYRLKGLKKNKDYTHMQAYAWGTQDLRLLTANPNNRYNYGSKLYTDGDLFVCIKVTDDDIYNSKGIKLAYLLLAPDGRQVTLPHYLNKGKFARVKNK